MREETMTFPRTRQGIRDLNRVPGSLLPVSGSMASSAGERNVGDTERWISAVSGGMLTLASLRGGALGWSALALGGALLYRGVSGHCAVYNAMGLNTAEPRYSDRPAEVVYRPV